MTKSRRLLVWIMSVVISQLLVPWSAMAQQGPSNLDLGSTARTVTVDLGHTETREVTVNDGSKVMVGPGATITPAQYAAYMQVLNSPTQGLVLGSGGNAVGGSLFLTPTLSQNLSSLVIPKNVSLISDFAHGDPLSLAGTLTNAGRFYAISTNQAVSNAIINAGNIFNQKGGLLTSVLPVGGFPGITGALSSLSLTLNAINNLINYGAITSSANLNINAGGSITNALPAGLSGVSPVMQAVNNLNLSSQLGSITNAGLMAAVAGNVNVASANNIVFNNLGGTVQALAGQINFRDALFDLKQHLDLSGGHWLSQELNAYSGRGNTNINVESLSGLLNSSSHEFHAIVNAGSLQLGSLLATGDPLIAVTGDLDISGNVGIAGAPLALVAFGNIRTTAPGLTISTADPTGSGGSILISAGFPWISDGADILVLDRATGGGSIDFSTNPLLALSSKGGAGPGGNITLMTSGGALNAGTIALPSALTVNADGTGSNPGNVVIVADAAVGRVDSPNSIDIGGVSAIGTAAASFGNVTIATAHPLLVSTGSDAAANPAIRILGPNSAFPGAGGGGALAGSSSIGVGAVKEGMSMLVRDNISSNGGNVILLSGSQVSVLGNISTKSNTAAVPSGNVTVTSTSPLALEVAPAGGSNRLSGTIDVGSATVGADGGTISLFNTGTGGISIDNNTSRFLTTVSDGKGASISLDAGPGTLRIDDNSALGFSVNASGTGAREGGSITFTADRFEIASPALTPVALQADGADTGKGGTVSLVQTGRDNINVGNAAQSFLLQAKGGTGGDGGTASVSSFGTLLVNTNGLVVNAQGNGKGGSVSLTTDAESTVADIRITGTLSLNGAGNGDGGTVTVNSGSLRPFSINGAGAANNGILGSINADAGPGTGKGGEITISSSKGIDFGAGANQLTVRGGGTSGLISGGGSVTLTGFGSAGITLDNPDNIGVSPVGGGNGGNITLNSPNGPLTITNAGTFDLNASGAGNRNGGVFTADILAIVASSNFNVNANGNDTGNGGTVDISTTSISFNLSRGQAGNQIFARGGNNSGAGGTIDLSSGRNLSLDMAGINAQPMAGNGKGSTYSFTAGSAFLGDLLITGAGATGIVASGLGAGDGGSVTLVSKSATSFVFSGATTNGILGAPVPASIEVQAGAGGGKGGTVSVTNNGAAGIGQVAPTTFNLQAVNGAGGTLELAAPAGPISFSNGNFNVSGAGAGINQGGTINISADLLNSSAGGSVNLIASGVGGGKGGTITLSESGDSQQGIVIGNAATQFSLVALGSGSGDGGTITVSASLGLTGDKAFINADPQGAGGAGGKYILESGTLLPAGLSITNGTFGGVVGGNAAGSDVTLTSSADIFVEGINANGSGTGNGGIVIITSGLTANVFDVGNGVVPNGVQNAINASGAAGGHVTITSPSGINILDPADINAVATNGKGGLLTLRAPDAILTIDTSTSNILNFSAVGAAGGDGGNIELNAGEISITGSGTPLMLSADALSTGKGGDVKVISTFANADLSFDVAAAQMRIGAFGGLLGGDGGLITLSSGRLLTVNMLGVVSSPQGGNSKGSSFVFSSGTATQSLANLNVTGTINANGLNNGSAGNVTLNAGDNLFVNGSISASGHFGSVATPSAGGLVTLTSRSEAVFDIGAGAITNGVNGSIGVSGGTTAGSAGGISITSSGFGGIRLKEPSVNILTTTVLGNGAAIIMNAPSGAIAINSSLPGTISTAGGGIGTTLGQTNGGALSMTALAILLPLQNVQLNSNGSGNASFGGSAGPITITTLGSSSIINVGAGTGSFSIQADGVGNGGNGGIISLRSGARMIVDPSQISIGQGNNSFGGSLDLTVTGQAGGCCGSVLVTGSLNYATGPTVSINVNSTTPFIIGQPTAGNGIQGGVNLSGSSGGSLNVKNSGSGGVNVSSGTTINVDGTGISQSAGSVTLDAGTGPFTMGDSNISAISSALNGNGGNITLAAKNLIIAPGTLGATSLQADGGVRGAGGTITITMTGSTQKLSVGSGKGQFDLSASGGAKGGTISLTSSAGITINSNNLQFAALGDPVTGLNGDGGTINLTTTSKSSKIFISGNLNVNAGGSASGFTGLGSGGTIKITTASTSPFTISPTAKTNGIAGTLQANAGAAGGDGGTIELNLGASSLKINGGTTLSGNAIGTVGTNGGTFDGGSIKLTTGPVSFLSAGVFTIQATGAGNGNGGTIQLFTTASNLIVGGAKGQFDILATGGSLGSQFGDGGSVSVKSSGQILLNDLNLISAQPLGSNGNGGTLSLSTKTGSIISASGLSVDGVGIGDGGNLTLKASGAANFLIGSGFAGTGINGNLSANAGSTRGKGGSVQVETLGSISFQGGTSIGASGTGLAGDGGFLKLGGKIFTFTGGSQPVFLQAGGGSVLQAGGSFFKARTIELTTLNNIEIGPGAKQFSISATGGSAGSFAGNGGKVTISSNTVTLDPAGLSINPLGSVGNGGELTITSKNQIFISAGLNLNAGILAGDGGKITINENTGNVFGINAGVTLNGVNGSFLNVNSGSLSGNGGKITINNSGTGGISLGSATTFGLSSGAAPGDTAGTLKISSPKGPFSSQALAPINAKGLGKGGTIDITASTITGPTGIPMTLSAAGVNADGGTVKLKTTSSTVPLLIGFAAGETQILAGGGASLFGSTNGGTIDISSGFDLSVNEFCVVVNTQGANGNGGKLTLAANTAKNSNLFITGPLTANGKGIGNGGEITLITKTQTPFAINPGATISGVNGSISANAGNLSGNGGEITLSIDSSSKAGGVTFGAGQTLFVNSSGEGNGGKITVTASSAKSVQLPITFTGAPIFSVNGSGRTGNGGEISFIGARFVGGGGNIALNANGGSQGSGGTITLQANGLTGFGSDIITGAGANQFAIIATGGSLNSRLGNGGEITLSVGSISNNLLVSPGPSFLFGPQGNIGNGGELTLTSVNNVFSSGSLTASGAAQSGNGGTITINAAAAQSKSPFNIFAGATVNGVNGSITASGGGMQGNGGTVTIKTSAISGLGGFGGIGFAAVQDVVVDHGANSGNGGSITLNSGSKADINFNNLTVLSSNGFRGNGGTITLSTRNLLFNSANNLQFQAQAQGNIGNGGTVSLTTTNSTGSFNINNAPGGFSFDVVGSGSGDGGTVNVAAGNVLNINANGLTLFALPEKGAELSLSSKGKINTTGVLDTGNGSKSKLTITNTSSSGSILQDPAGRFQANLIVISSQKDIGTQTQPLSVRAGADVLSGLQVTGKNVFLTQDIGSAVLANSSAKSIFNLNTTASSNLFVAGSVIGGTLNLATANNGSLTVQGNLTGPAFVSLSANANGSIQHFDGAIGTNKLSLSSGNGAIGDPLAKITSTASFVSVNTAQSAFIFNTKAVTLNASNVATALDIAACGNMTVLGNIQAPNLTLGAFNGNIKASGTVLNGVTTIGMSFANNATLFANNPLNLTTSVVGQTLTLSSLSAITVVGAVSANRANLTSGFNQNINFVAGSSISGGGSNPVFTLATKGTGNVTVVGAGSIGNGAAGSSLVLKGASGNFGSLIDPIISNVDTLSFSALGATSDLFVSQSNGLTTAANSKIGRDANIVVTAGNLTLNSLTVGRDMNLQVNLGALDQIIKSSLTATNGSINLTTSNAANGFMNLNGFIRTNGIGNVTLNSANSITVNNFTAKTGNVDITANNGGISLASGKTLSASNGNINLTTTNVTNGIMNLNGLIRTSVFGQINITSAAAVTTAGLSTGTQGAAGANNINVAMQPLSTGSFTLLTGGIISTGNNGNINITTQNPATGSIISNGFIRTNSTGTITMTAAGGGVNSGGMSTGTGNINVTANNGAISLPSFMTISTNTGNISLNTLSNANGSMNLNGFVRTNVTGTITINSALNLTVNSFVSTKSGNINLRADSGTLQIGQASTISTKNGDINIQQRGLLVTDIISILPGASISALSSSIPLGNINIFVDPGAGPPPQVPGNPPPGNVNLVTSGGGSIFFGSNFNPGITANAPISTLTAKGANVTFFTNAGSAAGAGAITLGGSNFLFADPPLTAAPAMVAPATVALATAVSSSSNVIQSPLFEAAGSPEKLPTVIVARSQMQVLLPEAGQSSLTATDTISRMTSSPESDSFKAMTSPISPGKTTGATAESSPSGFQQGRIIENTVLQKNSRAYLRPSQTAVWSAPNGEQIELESGELLLSTCRKPIIVNAGRYKVQVAAGSIVLVSREGTVTKVRSLVDEPGNESRITVCGRSLKVAVGEEVIVGNNDGSVDTALKADKLGRRDPRKFLVDEVHAVVRSEVSLVALISNSKLLSTMYSNGTQSDRQVIERVMKMAACLFQVTGKRGAYSAIISIPMRAAQQG